MSLKLSTLQNKQVKRGWSRPAAYIYVVLKINGYENKELHDESVRESMGYSLREHD